MDSQGSEKVKPLGFVNSLTYCMAAGVTPMFWGPPGEGKTALFERLKDIDVDVIVILGSIRQPFDFLGYPNKSERGMDFTPPEWAYRAIERQNAGKKTLLMFDEMTTSPPAVQAAMLRIINEGEMCDGKIKFDRKYTFMGAASNPKSQSMGFDLTVAMKNRFVHINANTDDEWFDWCEGKQSTNDIINFKSPSERDVFDVLRIVAKFVKEKGNSYINQASTVGRDASSLAYCSKRTWHYCAKILACAEVNQVELSSIQHLVEGSIGEQPTIEFIDFYNKHRSIVDLDYILNNIDTVASDERFIYTVINLCKNFDYVIELNEEQEELSKEEIYKRTAMFWFCIQKIAATSSKYSAILFKNKSKLLAANDKYIFKAPSNIYRWLTSKDSTNNFSDFLNDKEKESIDSKSFSPPPFVNDAEFKKLQVPKLPVPPVSNDFSRPITGNIKIGLFIDKPLPADMFAGEDIVVRIVQQGSVIDIGNDNVAVSATNSNKGLFLVTYNIQGVLYDITVQERLIRIFFEKIEKEWGVEFYSEDVFGKEKDLQLHKTSLGLLRQVLTRTIHSIPQAAMKWLALCYVSGFNGAMQIVDVRLNGGIANALKQQTIKQ